MFLSHLMFILVPSADRNIIHAARTIHQFRDAAGITLTTMTTSSNDPTITTITTKSCTCCKQVKPAGAFPPRNNARGGLQPWCRDCIKDRREGKAPSGTQSATTRKVNGALFALRVRHPEEFEALLAQQD